MAVLIRPKKLTVPFCAFGEKDDEKLTCEPHTAKTDIQRSIKTNDPK